MRMTRLIFPGLMIMLSMLMVPTAGVAQGNSATAKDCQKGGYLDFVDDEGNAFRNTGQCVRYVAQGGTLVPIPVATLLVTYSGDNQLTITGTGLLPGSVVTYTCDGCVGGTVPDSTVQGDGTVDVTNSVGCGYTNFVASATTSEGGTISSTPSTTCVG